MAIITVGPARDYTTISAAVAAANAGDTIDVAAGTYTNDFPTGITQDLTLQGVGGMVNMVATRRRPTAKRFWMSVPPVLLSRSTIFPSPALLYRTTTALAYATKAARSV